MVCWTFVPDNPIHSCLGGRVHCTMLLLAPVRGGGEREEGEGERRERESREKGKEGGGGKGRKLLIILMVHLY